MRNTTFNWYGRDGKQIFGQLWQPDSEVRTESVIILIHGMGEHSNRYEHFARFFTSRAYAILACDLRGHGQSEGKRGHVSKFDVFFEQVDKLLEESSKRFPGVPKFIYGHSMGGNIVTSHALNRHPRVMGVIASAPWLKIDPPVPNNKVMQAKAMNYVWGSYAESNQLDVDKLSRDRNVVETYINDPLVHDKVSVRLFLEGTTYAEYCLSNAPQLDIPMLLMHGSADAITSAAGSAEFAAKAADYAEYKEWPGLYHEIHNEPEQQEVMTYAYNWMQEELASSSSATV